MRIFGRYRVNFQTAGISGDALKLVINCYRQPRTHRFKGGTQGGDNASPIDDTGEWLGFAFDAVEEMFGLFGKVVDLAGVVHTWFVIFVGLGPIVNHFAFVGG